MLQSEEKVFTLPTIAGISEKTLNLHLGLYKGYVKNLNDHYREIANETNPIALTALTRRLGFELAGVQQHERYFEALVGGPAPLKEQTKLHEKITEQFSSFEVCIGQLQTLAMEMRGPGWVTVVYDKEQGQLHLLWIADHELGAVTLPALLAVDMWEHAYLVDYPPSEKKDYVHAYLSALNWETLAQLFETL